MTSLPALGPYLIFLVSVALATIAQNLTGFAFSLILLSLVAVFDLATIHDAANAAMILSLANAWAYFRLRGASPPWRWLRPTLTGSLVGVAIGVGILTWLGNHSVQMLRALLGASIIVCAVLLLLQRQGRSTMSPPPSFTAAGVLSGLLGGLFSTGGPPLVFHMFRQPMPAEQIRQALIASFAFTSLARLVMVLGVGGFTMQSFWLAAGALPVVQGITWAQHRIGYAPSPAALRLAVTLLLILSGIVLLVPNG
ncbi:TSUP family transporter [Verticiella sediminum]|uniref:Probable membrane transporter protein n=1 Tax=Verticiella sediminum TaxID=1247510 RepID=A0A556AB95_9BURK|nr:TSUP family transporter [Verticiella sediminum]TSH90164.1 TSUP family transporter [Verticiella sediminum]